MLWRVPSRWQSWFEPSGGCKRLGFRLFYSPPLSRYSSVWQSAWFGTKKSEVQILLFRPTECNVKLVNVPVWSRGYESSILSSLTKKRMIDRTVMCLVANQSLGKTSVGSTPTSSAILSKRLSMAERI